MTKSWLIFLHVQWEARTCFTALVLVRVLTLRVPDEVKHSGFQKPLWVFVYCNMKLNVIDRLNVEPLKTQNPK